MKKWLLSALCLASLNSFAQVNDFNILVDSRGDQMPATDVTRLQGRIRIGFTISAGGIVDIVGLASTGPGFNNDWATVATTNGTKDELTLAFRNIYLRKVIGAVTAEAGALNPEPTVGSGGLAPSGWMDGIRVRVNTKIGDIKVVAGSLGDFKTPNAFAREFKGNFLEIEMDHKLFENVLTQTAVEHFNGDIYLRENLKIDLKILGDKVFKVFADALYDIERNSFSYELGTEFDVLKTLVYKYDHRLDFKVYFSNVNENIPNRNNTITAFYTYGPRLSVQVGGKLDHKGDVNWFARGSFGAQNRYDVGVSIKIPVKKPRK